MDLLNTSFETFEEKIRDQLGRVLGGGGFDPARDIVAIIVNRWPHGYAYSYNSLYDPMEWVYGAWAVSGVMHFEGRRPCLVLENNENRGQITLKIKGDGGSKI